MTTRPTPSVVVDEVEIASAAFSDDECVICGKSKSQHNRGSGYAMCMGYPLFVSKREMFKRLAPLAASDRDVLVRALTDARNNILSLLGGFRDDMPDAAVKLFQAQARQIDAALVPLGGGVATLDSPRESSI